MGECRGGIHPARSPDAFVRRHLSGFSSIENVGYIIQDHILGGQRCCTLGRVKTLPYK